MNIMIPEGEDDYVSGRDKETELILSACAAVLTLIPFCFTERVPGPGAV